MKSADSRRIFQRKTVPRKLSIILESFCFHSITLHQQDRDARLTIAGNLSGELEVEVLVGDR